MAFDFYFAGTQCKEADELIHSLNANVLKSYANDKKSIKEWFLRKERGWCGKLMIDNGEFTYHRKGGSLDIDEYIAWLNDNDAYIDYAIALDKIPGEWGKPRTLEQVSQAPRKTWENYLYMKDRVVSPRKLLPVFHQYEDFKWLMMYLQDSDLQYMCLSGNKELTNSQREDWYNQCYDLIDMYRPDIKVHCLGSATRQNAEKYPFASMDATTWIMVGANGGILTDVGVIYVGKNIMLNDQERCAIEKIVSRYGMSVEDILEDYKSRMLVNVHYLYDMSNAVVSKNSRAKRRRLF